MFFFAPKKIHFCREIERKNKKWNFQTGWSRKNSLEFCWITKCFIWPCCGICCVDIFFFVFFLRNAPAMPFIVLFGLRNFAIFFFCKVLRFIMFYFFFCKKKINPCAVIGRELNPDVKKPNTSNEILRDVINGEYPRINLYVAFVDVYDVALAHIAAMENPKAHGRFLNFLFLIVVLFFFLQCCPFCFCCVLFGFFLELQIIHT